MPTPQHDSPPGQVEPERSGTSFLVQRTRRRSLVSFELFPPRQPLSEVAPGQEGVWESISKMAEAGPDYFSVTHGHNQRVGGNREVIRHLRTKTDVPVMAHIICAGSTTDQLREAIEQLLDDGIRDMLALRGDPPPDADEWVPTSNGLNRASELVRLIRELEHENFEVPVGPGARQLSVAVAAYPPSAHSRDYAADLASLWDKQQAGADYAITQVFYNPEDYAQLVDDARSQGISLPIVAGIAPMTNPQRLKRLGEISGVTPPPRLLEFLDTDPAEQRHRGTAATLQLIDTLLDYGCPGLHLYTFNRHPAALAILDHLRIRDAAQQQTSPLLFT